jgi:hypothetical protein
MILRPLQCITILILSLLNIPGNEILRTILVIQENLNHPSINRPNPFPINTSLIFIRH